MSAEGPAPAFRKGGERVLPQPQTYPCPNCDEIINDRMERCPHCSAPVDREAAAAAAAVQASVNQACSDASFLRTAAFVMWAFLLLSLLPIPFIPLTWMFVVTFFVVLVLLVRWYLRFSRLETRDPDYRQARRSWNLALLLWLAALPLGLVLRVLAELAFISLA